MAEPVAQVQTPVVPVPAAKPVAYVAPLPRIEPLIVVDPNNTIPDTYINTGIFDSISVGQTSDPVEYENDDMVVVATKEETKDDTLPYAAVASAFVPAPVVQTPVVQAPIVQTPVVQTPYVQAPVAHTPVAYYAPSHGYQAAPATYEVVPVAPVAAPAPTHSQFHGQVQ